MKLFLLLFLCHVSSSVKHSLKYFYTGSSGIPNFPEFVGTAELDDILLGSCDTKRRIVETKHDWTRKIFDSDPHHLEHYTRQCFDNLPSYLTATIQDFKKRFNQTGGAHIIQQMCGVEWDDETDDINGFNQYAYDGEDYISFDLKRLTWVAPKPQAVITKMSWDADKARTKHNEMFLTQIFLGWLKKYVVYGRESLMRTELPSVYLLQKTPSSPISCHATGFYPDRAVMFWRKDGEELHEDVEYGEILPNHDGTFQMSVDLTRPSATSDGGKYDCVFHLSGVSDDIVTELGTAEIRSNRVPSSEFPAAAVIGAVAGLMLLALCVGGFFIWKRKYNGFTPAKSSESSSTDVTSED